MFRHSHIEYMTVRYLIKSHQLVEFIPPNDGTPMPVLQYSHVGNLYSAEDDAKDAPLPHHSHRASCILHRCLGRRWSTLNARGWGWGRATPQQMGINYCIGYTVIYIDLWQFKNQVKMIYEMIYEMAIWLVELNGG